MVLYSLGPLLLCTKEACQAMSLGRNGQDKDEDQSGTSGKHRVQHQLFLGVARGEIDPCTQV